VRLLVEVVVGDGFYQVGVGVVIVEPDEDVEQVD